MLEVSSNLAKEFSMFLFPESSEHFGGSQVKRGQLAVETFRLSSSFAIMGDVMAGSSCAMAKPMSKISSHTAF